MKPVHVLGLGLIVGMAALGAMLSAVAFKWQEAAYFQLQPAPGAQQPGSRLGGPASPQVEQGRTVFRQSCSSCHTIGGGRLAGPDLKGITTQRPRDWLIETIVAPDQVIARGDPIATELVKEYGVPMPNVGVSREQAEQVLTYIEFQTGSASPGSPPPPAGAAAAPPAAPAAAPAKAPTTPTLQAPRTGAAGSQEAAQAKALFDQKCSGCHTIGGGRRVGPDLQGATQRRPRDWLIDFITDPDRVIASGDSAATQLVQEYGGTRMPNLGISREQAEQLLGYIGASGGGGPPAAATPAGGSAATPAPAGTAVVAATVASTPQATRSPTAASAAPAAAPAKPGSAQGKTIFDQKCASCHSLGGGRLLGPDLKGITTQRPRDFLIETIVAPDKLLARGDPTATQLAKEYGMPMPNVGVTADQAEQILAYIEAQSGGGAPAAAAAAAPAALPPGDASAGRALFLGQRPLANGGPACAACHTVAGVGTPGGGNWGADLTRSHSKTGAAGLAAIARSPQFPGMREAFASRPVTDAEAADLVAFLAEIDAQQAGAPSEYVFPLIGVAVLLILVVLAQLAWRNRTPAVWEQLVKGE